MGRRGCGRDRDRIVDGCITIYAISSYHHKCCEFESCSGEVYSIQYCVIKFASDLWQVNDFLRVLWFPLQINDRYDITEIFLKSGIKHQNPNPLFWRLKRSRR